MKKENNADETKRYGSDYELFQALIDNDQDAKEQFHKTIGPVLYLIAFKKVKDRDAAFDIATEAFIRSLEKGGPFNDLEHVTRYMYNAVGYEFLNYLRRAKAKKNNPSNKVVPLEKKEEAIGDELTIEAEITRAENRKALHAQIAKLPEMDRRILILTLENKTNDEIAEELGCTTRYVRDRRNKLARDIRNALVANKIITVLFLLIFIK
jgi:RNA polymerase sigma-70 factor (ECF subfamily)